MILFTVAAAWAWVDVTMEVEPSLTTGTAAEVVMMMVRKSARDR